MTTCECAEQFAFANLPREARILPRRTVAAICEAYVLNRGKLHGPALRVRIREHCRSVGAIPPWLITLLLNLAISALMRTLDKWWEGRHKA